MMCEYCGLWSAHTDHFCANCGRRLDEAQASRRDRFHLQGAQGRVPGERRLQAAPLSEPSGSRLQAVPVTGPVGPMLEAAGFGRRAAGYLIDAGFWLFSVVVAFFIVVSVEEVLGATLGFDVPEDDITDTGGAIFGWVVLLGSFVMQWSGNATGWSPGRSIMGIRTVRDDGTPPGVGRGLGRTVAAWFSAFALGLGYLWALWDGQHQTWHDKIAGVTVVRQQPRLVAGSRAPSAL